jgi:hypothetical protein
MGCKITPRRSESRARILATIRLEFLPPRCASLAPTQFRKSRCKPATTLLSSEPRGGGVYNITMKSGANQYHGSGYEYFVNEDLNAAGALSQSSSGANTCPETAATITAALLADRFGCPRSTTATTRPSSFSVGNSFVKTLASRSTTPCPCLLILPATSPRSHRMGPAAYAPSTRFSSPRWVFPLRSATPWAVSFSPIQSRIPQRGP